MAHRSPSADPRPERVDPKDGPIADPGASIVHQRLELLELIEGVLEGLSPRDREILERFYVREQAQDRICAEMGLTETQFRLLNSRAKARFGQLARKRSTGKHGAIPRQDRLRVTTPRDIAGIGSSPLVIDRILPVVAHAVAVFGDEHKASHWLSSPLPLLAGSSPCEVIEREGGVDVVEQILTRIEHNIPS